MGAGAREAHRCAWIRSTVYRKEFTSRWLWGTRETTRETRGVDDAVAPSPLDEGSWHLAEWRGQTASDAERGDPEFGCGLGGLGGSSCVRTAVAETRIPEGHPGLNETLGKRQRADGPQIRAVETGWVDEETEV